MKRQLILLFLVIAFGFICMAEESLPNGYRKIRFGMDIDSVKDELKADKNFGFRGDRDVSLMSGENRMLIETDTSRTAPYSMLERCWFQFYEDKLYIITLNMKQSRLDHYSVFVSLTEKYGQPTFISPEKSEWKDNDVIMTLERPLTIKYIDKKVFEKLQEDAMVKDSMEEQVREKFLEGL